MLFYHDGKQELQKRHHDKRGKNSQDMEKYVLVTRTQGTSLVEWYVAVIWTRRLLVVSWRSRLQNYVYYEMRSYHELES